MRRMTGIERVSLSELARLEKVYRGALKDRIEALWLSGVPVAQIAKYANLPRPTVYRKLEALRELEYTPDDARGPVIGKPEDPSLPVPLYAGDTLESIRDRIAQDEERLIPAILAAVEAGEKIAAIADRSGKSRHWITTLLASRSDETVTKTLPNRA